MIIHFRFLWDIFVPFPATSRLCPSLGFKHVQTCSFCIALWAGRLLFHFQLNHCTYVFLTVFCTALDRPKYCSWNKQLIRRFGSIWKLYVRVAERVTAISQMGSKKISRLSSATYNFVLRRERYSDRSGLIFLSLIKVFEVDDNVNSY